MNSELKKSIIWLIERIQWGHDIWRCPGCGTKNPLDKDIPRRWSLVHSDKCELAKILKELGAGDG